MERDGIRLLMAVKIVVVPGTFFPGIDHGETLLVPWEVRRKFPSL